LPSVAPPSGARLIASLIPPGTPQIAFYEESPAYAALRTENEALRTQLMAMAASMAHLRRDVLDASEGELVKLACAIAERVARRELLIAPSLVVTWAREGIDALGTKEHVVIAIAPDLAAALGEHAWADVACASVAVETDASLGSFQCEVRAQARTVDAGLEGRVAAITRELGVSPE
jgi:flagellar biosynthesis/type III secretory pathway protein FliH